MTMFSLAGRINAADYVASLQQDIYSCFDTALLRLRWA
jgi:hypothetical protein